MTFWGLRRLHLEMKVCPCNTVKHPGLITQSSLSVRKAYRRRALETHPDKLDPGANEEEKQEAEQQFHKVSPCASVDSQDDPQLQGFIFVGP